MQSWFGILIVVGALGFCTRQAQAPDTPVAFTPVCTVSGELVCIRGQLSLAEAGAPDQALPAGAAIPYQVVALGPPALVTTCSTELDLATWALGPEPVKYHDALPLISIPPLTALCGLPTGPAAPELVLTLLDIHGGSVWHSDYAQLLLPVVGAREPDREYIAEAKGGDPLTPLGDSPELLKVVPSTGVEDWRVSLADYAGFAEVTLIGLSRSFGLLCLQYNPEYSVFLRFERSSGVLGPDWPLEGQPHQVGIYPGPMTEMGGATQEGSVITMFVYPISSPFEYWRFDLEQGTMAREPAAGPPPVGWVEENTLSVGGDGAPSLSNPPFPQQLLPTVSGLDWRVPALRDAEGRVLVVDDQGAHWVSLPSATAAASQTVAP